MSKHKRKYDIGYQFYNYEIIDIVNHKSNGRAYSRYAIKCLECGEIIERASSEIDKNIKCPGCDRNMKYYRYDVGDIVNDLEILEKQRQVRSNGKTQRAYLCKCVVDGYTSVHSEDNLLKGRGCPVCANTIIATGINDINTVAPWLGDLMENKEDGYKYSSSSHFKVRFRCPHCGTLTKNISIYNVYTTKHIACRKCGDGISTPEKIMYGMLEALQVDFEYQKKFDWSCEKFYDFYIADMNMIIETHGLQHYRDTHGAWDELESIKQNDAIKQELAIYNGVKNYIVIDCSNSLPTSLIDAYKQALSKYFDFSHLDFNSIILTSLKSFCIKAGDMWNMGNYNIASIANNLRVNERTVRTYLKTLETIGYLNINYPINNK